MWFVLAVLLLAPLGWALAGCPDLSSAPAAIVVTDWLSHIDTVAVPEVLRDRTQDVLQLLDQARALTSPVPTPPLTVAMVVGAVLALGPGRSLTKHVVTMVHEFGHGLAAGLLGGSVTSITTSPDGSGLARWTGAGHGRIRNAVAGSAGYVAPLLLSVASLRALLAGWSEAWLLYIAATVAGMLILSLRSLWAAFVALVLIMAAVTAAHLGPWSAVLLAGLVGALAAGGFRDALAQWRHVDRGMQCDAGIISAELGLSPKLVAAVHVLMVLGLASLVPWLAVG